MADKHTAHGDEGAELTPNAPLPNFLQKTPLQKFFDFLPKLLMLMAIWGAAVFLWGTFGAWTRTQHEASERGIAEAQTGRFRVWLDGAIAPLQRLATDGRLAAGMDLPAGVESLPIQRVLYEYAYLTNQSEVYVVDMLKRRVGRTASATPLPPEVLARLEQLPDVERMVMGLGQRNGQMLLIHKVKAPLPQRLLVMVPVSLMTLGANEPAAALPGERTLSVVVPHTTGWAQWRTGATSFDFDEALSGAMDGGDRIYEVPPHLTVLAPVRGIPDVWLAVEGPGAISGTRLLPQLLVGLWAVVMSALVLLNNKAQRAKLAGLLGPVMGPLGKVVGPIGGALGAVTAAIGAKWRDAQAAPPLVAGPGAFGAEDFVGVDELAKRENLAKRKPKGSDALRLAQTTAAAPEKVERRAKVRGGISAQRPGGPPMKWPEDQAPAPLKPKSEMVEPTIDNDDMRAVVEDCLRKKRVKLLYQPIIRAGDNMPVMHEVYARLVREDGIVIPPDIFLPIAIKHKLALELDLVVLRKVVNEHFIGGSTPATPLALNISSTSLDGIAYLQEMTNQGPRVLQKMSFEVRSQEMIRDPKALRLLKDLQKHGGNLAVDYFGGGIAMLDASKAMGFNYVKLNCMRLSGTDAGKKEMIMLCHHAQKIGLPIIMEMIGDKEAYDFSKRAGAEFLQGYALMRPQDNLTIRPLTPDLDGIKNLAATPL